MFARLKDWRGIATRYDRCAHLLLGHLQRALACGARRLRNRDVAVRLRSADG